MNQSRVKLLASLMSRIVALLLVCGICPTSSAADVDDCVLNGLKGVNSDVAARMVRQSCESKVANQRRQQLSSKYGEKLDAKLTQVNWELDYSKDTLKVTLRNELPQTVTYAELSISKPENKGECPYPDQRKYLYSLKIKPGSSAVLIVPGGTLLVSKDQRSTCIFSRAVRGKESSVFDVSIGSVLPLTESQVEMVNQELSERYATIDSPAYSSQYRGILFDFKVEDLLRPK